MSNRLLFVVVMILAAGCAKKDSPPESSAPQSKESILTKNQWCSKFQMGGVTFYTRYNFTHDPSAYRSNLTQDRIVVRDGGDTQVYVGEALTPWALQKDGSTKGEVFQGYRVELVSDPDKVSQMVRDESIKSTDEKPIKMALNLYSDFFSLSVADNNKVTRAFPCGTLVDTSKIAPRKFAEFQILTGRDVRNNTYVRWETKEFWSAMDMAAPIQEIPSTPQEISSHAWCNWWYASDESRYGDKPGKDKKYDLLVKVKVFSPSGATSEQDYVGSFHYSKNVLERFAELAGQARQTSWAIDKSQRLSSSTKIDKFELPNLYKLVEDKSGRKAIFSVNSEQPDFPLSVGVERMYYDCAEPAPFTFQPEWGEWIPKIADLQLKALK